MVERGRRKSWARGRNEELRTQYQEVWDKLIINQDLQDEGMQLRTRRCIQSCLRLQNKWWGEGLINISHNIAIKQTKMTVISPSQPYITFHYVCWHNLTLHNISPAAQSVSQQEIVLSDWLRPRVKWLWENLTIIRSQLLPLLSEKVERRTEEDWEPIIVLRESS